MIPEPFDSWEFFKLSVTLTSGMEDDGGRKRPKHNYTEEEKKIWIGLMVGDENHDPIPVMQLIGRCGAPSQAELFRWKHEYYNPQPISNIPTSMDFRSLLSVEQCNILGGYCLDRLSQHLGVNLDEVILFVKEAFGVTVSPQWASEHLHQLHFSSHRTRPLLTKYKKIDVYHHAITFLKKLQPQLQMVKPISRIVAMDQISFWNNGLVVSCFGPIGG